MRYDAILMTAAETVNSRGKNYGDVDFMFETAANLATLMTGKAFTKYEVTTILEAVKLARRRVNPLMDDNYIDGINYSAFSGYFAKEAFVAADTAQSTEEDDIAAMAKRFAPIKQENTHDKNYQVSFDGTSTNVAVKSGNGE
jgi:hypothetical protein